MNEDKTIASYDTALLGALSCLGYKPELLRRNSEHQQRIEFVFKKTKKLEKDIKDIINGKKKFKAHDLAIDLHVVRSKIKNFINSN